jgi:hypothetical protein
MHAILWSISLAMAGLPSGALAQPAASGDVAPEGTPVPGAPIWVLQPQLPGTEKSCRVRAEGPEANTTLVINGVGQPVLIVGRGDWRSPGGEAKVSLSIDGGRPAKVKASMVHSLVLVLVSDAGLLKRLRSARTIDWTFPFGHFRTDVAGFGIALDAVSACIAEPQR